MSTEDEASSVQAVRDDHERIEQLRAGAPGGDELGKLLEACRDNARRR